MVKNSFAFVSYDVRVGHESAIERRVDERTSTNVSLMCRVPAIPTRAIMHDLSLVGCRLEFPNAEVELGGTTVLEVPGVTRIDGRVMWVRGNQAGIRFHRRLTETAAEVLGLEVPKRVEETVETAAPSGLRGVLRHWMRRLTDVFS